MHDTASVSSSEFIVYLLITIAYSYSYSYSYFNTSYKLYHVTNSP